jgi:molybdenum cofactor cytidylyltransferase
VVIAAIVLAAGTGTRFGATKQTALFGGRPLVRYPVDAARDAGIGEVVVVVGHDAAAVAAVVDDVTIVHNGRFEDGQASSLRAGLEAMGDEVDGVVVLLADQPGITTSHVRTLLGAAEEHGEPIVRLRFTDGPGPALLRREIWRELEGLEGDIGARVFVDRRADLVFDAVVEQDAPPDVDTVADLERLEGRRPSGNPFGNPAGNPAGTPPDPGYEKPPSF